MNVSKVNSVNFSKPVVPAFKSRTPENEDNANQIRHSNIANKMVTVPVSLLMALTAMAVNPAKPYDKTLETENTTMVAQAPQKKIIDNPHIAARKNSKGNYYFKTFTDELGNTYSVRLAHFEEDHDNIVRTMELIPHKIVENADDHYTIEEFIIHEPPNKDNWGGLWVREANDKTITRREIRIPDEISQDLVDFLVGDKPYKNLDVEAGQAGLRWSRTQSDQLRPEKVTQRRAIGYW